VSPRPDESRVGIVARA